MYAAALATSFSESSLSDDKKYKYVPHTTDATVVQKSP